MDKIKLLKLPEHKIKKINESKGYEIEVFESLERNYYFLNMCDQYILTFPSRTFLKTQGIQIHTSYLFNIHT